MAKIKKNILIIIVLTILGLIIVLGFYYFKSVEKPTMFFQNNVSQEKPLDIVQGVIRFETREYQNIPFKKAIFLTKEGKIYDLAPSNEEFYRKQGITEGKWVEIEGRIEKNQFFIGKIKNL